VIVRDLRLGTTTLVSVNRFGTAPGNGFSSHPQISAGGRFVAFDSYANDLVANDNIGTSDVFIRDLQLGTTTLVSVNRFGTGSGNGDSGWPVISPDGRFVAFQSSATDLVAAFDTNGHSNDVFVRDLQLGTTTLVSVNRVGTGSGNDFSVAPWITPDGRFVAFSSSATDLVAVFDTNGLGGIDLFVRDLQLGTTTLVTVNRFGTASGNGFSGGDSH
jgi:Tol biopolymer transport system component